MALDIGRVAVVGAGTMGAQIAAHFANVGIPAYLLDRAPEELTPAEAARGCSLEDPAVGNRIVREALQRARGLKPSPFFQARNAELITLGNMRDHRGMLAEADWVIEAVLERLDVKQAVLAEIEAAVRPGTLVTSNTSGLSITAMSAGRGDALRRRFCGTHFFNPPRYLHLLELIPTAVTDPALVSELANFGRRVLGKGIVVCKDTPYFIGNRIGCFAMSTQVLAMRRDGYTVDEVDAITGEAMLRPRSATFRLCDLVGLDLMVDVGENLYSAVPEDAWREVFRTPDFIAAMVERGWRGEKSGQGFYRRVRGPGGSEILALDLDTWEYRPRQRPDFASVAAAKRLAGHGERLRALVNGGDRAAAYAWRVLSETLVYAAARAEEIADDLPRIDDAMRWGWNWELGPFEQWDALGVGAVVARLESEGRAVPDLARQAMAAGGSFYRREGSAVQVLHFDGRWRGCEPEPGVLALRELKGEKTVQANADASLVDLGDGVLCLEFHSKLNTLGPGVLEMIRRAVAEVESRWEALVIGNQGRMFSAGANLVGLLAAAEARAWDQIDAMTREFQNSLMAVKQCRRPAVAAVHAQALGGGCELALQSARIQAAAESYMGLVELLVGLIPAGGGCKEMVLRSGECVPGEAGAGELWGPLHRAFETIGLAKVSTSAAEARELGFLRPQDAVSIDPDRHLQDAKSLALSLARSGYQPYRQRTDIPVLGEPALARFKMEVYLAERAGHISAFDRRLGTALATVLCGGPLTAARPVSEQYLLDLEREQFVSLCAEEKTLERIRHMLKTNRPLRN